MQPFTDHPVYQQLSGALAPLGMVAFGALHARDLADNPATTALAGVGTIVLLGNRGPAMWRAFSQSSFFETSPNALDNWARTTISKLTAELGAATVFPFDGPPYAPFLSWAISMGCAHDTPFGPLIHPEYGTWHGYRGALLFGEELSFDRPAAQPNPCDSCADQPCLSTCPVDAFRADQGGRHYDVPTCVARLKTAAGSDCKNQGCRARRACPIGRDFIYEPDQARFHMGWFMASCGPA